MRTTLDPLVYHMYTSALALFLTLPFGVFEFWALAFGDAEGSVQRPAVTLDTLWLIFLSILCHYGQNIASIYFLQHVNVLTHTVANTLKRLAIILGSVLYFKNEVAPLNGLGMGVALLGFFGYSLAHRRARRHKHAHHDDDEFKPAHRHETGPGGAGGTGSAGSAPHIAIAAENAEAKKE